MEEILLRVQKLEDEIKKEREINRLLQFQISSINDECIEKFNILNEKIDDIEQISQSLNKKIENILSSTESNTLNQENDENDDESTIYSESSDEESEDESEKDEDEEESKEEVIKKINTNEIFKKDLTFSKILDCVIDNKKPERMTYRNILINILKKMSKENILKLSSFNFKEEKVYSDNGYKWCEDIQLSIQDKDATKTLKEIIRLCEINKFSLLLKIQLSTKEIITYRSTK